MYTAETGVTVTVETTPWTDFQTKAFTEFNAKGDAYDMVVGDSQWLGAGSTGGHYVDLTDFFNEHKLAERDGPGDGQVLRRVSQRHEVLGDPARGRRRGLGLPQGLVRGPEGDGSLQGEVRLRPRRAEDLQADARHRRVLLSPRREELRHRHLHRQLLRRAWRWASRAPCSATAATSATTRPTRSTASSTRRRTSTALEMYTDLYGFTPPNWGKTFFQEDNQAITENLAAMSLNFFAFFPALANPAINPNAARHRLLRQPEGSGRRAACGARRPGHLDRHLLEEQGRGDEVPRVVHPRRRPAEVGRSRRLHLQPAVLKSDEFRNATPYNEAFYQSMFMVKDFWAVPEYAELLTAMNNRIYPFVVGGEGTAKEALDGLAADWNATFKKYGGRKSSIAIGGRGRHRLLRPPVQETLGQPVGEALASAIARAGTRHAGSGARMERSHHPQCLHPSDDRSSSSSSTSSR